ncbi:MAG TPA: hypothetical protein VFR94_09555 [Nitrososphaeraceae archaeon]|nr:hypothetical protein [Nitrososphaeraceae archaeon]
MSQRYFVRDSQVRYNLVEMANYCILFLINQVKSPENLQYHTKKWCQKNTEYHATGTKVTLNRCIDCMDNIIPQKNNVGPEILQILLKLLVNYIYHAITSNIIDLTKRKECCSETAETVTVNNPVWVTGSTIQE